MLIPRLKIGMVRIVRINDYEDLNKVLIDLKPGECALLLTRKDEGPLIQTDGIEVITLRNMGDKTEVDYSLALGKRVLCISNNGFGLLSEYALSRLRYVIISKHSAEQDSKVINMLLELVPG
ncbi:hypothetical protein B7L70_12050 [Vulcanisaeta sp. EB80]|jgi:hypothetical protein|uniref:hypothetical protein n=1 Tax=Vulcanisaeta sp. EB80 TaxID=1650660 RepID=UPI0009BDDCD7|nr:hypothetical protein [Vulcanisaeta sp. EB80]PLC62314.1 hypothetical protein B7L70_12050 [Vulcanisaeta sp. EB80]